MVRNRNRWKENPSLFNAECRFATHAAPGQENRDGRSMSQDPRPVMEMQNADAELKFVEF